MKQHRRHIFKWLFALWMLCCIGSVNAASQVEAPAAWRTTPVMSEDVHPNYEFRSTSSYAPVVGTTSYLATSTTVYKPGTSGPNRAKKDVWDEEPTDDAIATVDTPIGEPIILILFALAFILYKKKRATS
ncbi:MAG: hypothetical protein IJR42_06130 [Paludibacteraceae bacterium]|nr:hypothetical protein [Paludibacteraceae bacterium]